MDFLIYVGVGVDLVRVNSTDGSSSLCPLLFGDPPLVSEIVKALDINSLMLKDNGRIVVTYTSQVVRVHLADGRLFFRCAFTIDGGTPYLIIQPGKFFEEYFQSAGFREMPEDDESWPDAWSVSYDMLLV